LDQFEVNEQLQVHTCVGRSNKHNFSDNMYGLDSIKFAVSEKKILIHIPICPTGMLKQCPMLVDILEFRSTQKKRCKEPSNESLVLT
jgi:hypothetical protein